MTPEQAPQDPGTGPERGSSPNLAAKPPRPSSSSSPSSSPADTSAHGGKGPLPALLADLLGALAFLSRLGPASLLTPERIARIVPWFAPVGFLLGAIALIPHWVGLCQNVPTLCGLIYIALLAWLTRGLHWDGLMDLADALGSNAHGEKFWAIMKDSRVGAFAAMSLFFLGGVQALAASELFSANGWATLLSAPLAGRAACVVLLQQSPAWEGSTLAKTVKAGATPLAAVISAILIIAAAFWALCPLKAVLLLFAVAVFIFGLRRIAKKNHGLNGDFLGALILLVETATLLIGAL